MCKLGNHVLPSFTVAENEDYIALMDIFPPTFEGEITMPVVLVLTKKHFGSNVFEDLSDVEYKGLLNYSKKVAKAIQRAINPMRVCLVFEGMEIDHVHAKLYPIFEGRYPGYLSTIKSPNNKGVKAPDEFLRELAIKIREHFEDG